MSSLSDKIKELSKRYLDQVIQVRRHLHENPELSFEEYQTSNFIKAELDKLEIQYEGDWVKTGIYGEIKGGKSHSESRVALRADIDALPIQEQTGQPYASKNEGVMHACGHDMHTASLLGTLRILQSVKQFFSGTVSFVFQPGEELLPGGAKLMIEEGVFSNRTPKAILGQHVYPDLPAGKVGFRPGMYMASCDEIYITVLGKGGHAALPDKLVDPVMISAQLITALQQVISRRKNPKLPGVLSFGRIEGLGATNVIPDEVKIQGTFRTFDEAWRKVAHRDIKAIAEGLVASMGGNCEVDIREGYPFLANDEDFTIRSKQLAEEFLGAENVIDLDLRMTAEDFAYYSQRYPVCFYRLGTADNLECQAHGLHTPRFDVDESALETAMGLMAFLAINELEFLSLK